MARSERAVEVFADVVLEHRQLDGAVGLRRSNRGAEVAQRLRRVAAAPDARDGRHARVVPAAHAAFLHQLQQLALAQQRVGDVQPVELDLLRGKDAQLLDEPVVERAMVFKLQGADGVGDASRSSPTARARSRTSDRCTTCRRCDGAWRAGCGTCTGSRMFRLGDAMSILARSVREPSGNSPARMRSNRSRFSSTRAIAIRTLPAGLGQGAAILPHLLGAQVADVRLARLNQLDGPLVKLIEIVGRVVQAGPLIAQPVHVANDGIDVLLLFFLGIGVVEAQVGLAAKLRRQPKVQVDRLGMSEVQVAVGLGRKAGLHPSGELVRLEVGNDDVANEVGSLGRFGRRLWLVSPSRGWSYS